jgi:WD40 repeat protein
LLLTAPAQQVVSNPVDKLPKPDISVEGKKFNAVTFGPGNTFAILQTPPDYHLSTFAISSDGSMLATGWGSGRIELWQLPSKKKVAELKSGFGSPQILQIASGGKLIITGSGGKLAIWDIKTHKKVTSWTLPLGKYHYDLQEVLFDPAGRWLAYADQESSKIMDITGAEPKPVADLGDAYSLALSDDGNELWTVNRSQLMRYNLRTWKQSGHWELMSPPLNTQPAVVRIGSSQDGRMIIAVPSDKGLVFYTTPNVEGKFVTDQPTSAVAFAKRSRTFVNIAKELTFMDANGSVLCRKSYDGRFDYAVSADGDWLVLQQSDHVDLWRIDNLLQSCSMQR